MLTIRYPAAIGLTVLSLAAGIAFGQDVGKRKQDADFMKKLQGTWEVTRSEQNGQPMPTLLVNALPTITFTGNDFTWGNGETGAIVAIDASRNPITVDYMYTSGPRRGQVDPAIIRIDGDALTDCMPTFGGPRPNQFRTLPGDGQTMMSYRRTTQQRGNGWILNPWFYGGVVCALGALCLGFVACVVVLVVWLSRGPKTKELPRRSRGMRS